MPMKTIRPSRVFQFTPLREGRPPNQRRFRAFCNFNSRPSARGDSFAQPNKREIKAFQFTPLREGRRQQICQLSYHLNFNSRPSARGDHHEALFPAKQDISIHAPPRGATSRLFGCANDTLFQFTPLREGRPRYSAGGDSDLLHFNSRPSARGDAHVRRRFGRLPYISIHAPPRGATRRQLRAAGFQVISIHAPPRGATTAASVNTAAPLFQFTPLREGRPSSRARMSCACCLFQFTPLREGRLALPVGMMAVLDQFQFTPLREGRLLLANNPTDASIFQFTPLREGRRKIGFTMLLLLANFNSRPSARGDI